jgi:hypothetical protein
MAQQCCRSVFPETQRGEWDVNAIDAPPTAGYADRQRKLLHNDVVYNPAMY